MYGTTEPEAFAEGVRRSMERGFTAVKAMPVPVCEMIESPATLRRAECAMAAMRDAAGDKCDIMLDLHARTTPAAALQFGRMLAPYQPYWYEEPCWHEDVDAVAQISRALPFPVATGERLVTRWGFRELCEKRACAIVQPDVCHCGGISEARRIAALAETYQMAVACHNPQGPVAVAASAQVAFATPNYLIQEIVRADVPWRDEIVTDPLRLENGSAAPPRRPGLGVEIDETRAALHPFAPEVAMAGFHRDGSVADW
jgi:galactonate dehydratase